MIGSRHERAAPRFRRPRAPRKARLTIAQYYAICDAGVIADLGRTELISGEIYRRNAEYTGHMRAVLALYRALCASVETSGLALEVGSGGTTELGSRDAPQPDVFVRTGRDADKGVPDGELRLAIDVSGSTERRDLGAKRRLYARHGVPEYWVVILRTGRIERFAEPRDGDCARRDGFGFANAVDSVALRGVGIPAGTLAP